MDIFDIVVNENDSYVIGYAVAKKEKCEIYNFVSHTLRILRFLDGAAEWRVGNEIQVFRQGDIVIFNNLNRRNIHKVLTGTITYEFFDFFPSTLTNETLRNIFYCRTGKVVGTGDAVSATIETLLDSLKQELKREPDAFQVFSIQRHLDLLALQFYRSIDARELTVNAALQHISTAVAHIREHLAENLTIQALAGMCGYTPEYFCRVFKHYFGVSPIAYIITLRLENALRLIDTEHMTVQDAAFLSGYRSPSAFYKAFAKYKRTSPASYLAQPR